MLSLLDGGRLETPNGNRATTTSHVHQHALVCCLFNTPAANAAGVSSTPSPDIGSARRLLVPDRDQQSRLLLQAAANHQPDVLVVTEMSSQQDVEAAVLAARSHNMLLVAAVPAVSLELLLQDSTLCQLVGCERALSTVSVACDSRLLALRAGGAAVALFGV